MKKILPILIISLLLACVHSARAQSAVIAIDTAGFMDENNVIQNNMTWGLVIDTNSSGGSGFSDLQTNLNSFTVPTAGSSAQLTIGGVLSDLYFFVDSTNNETEIGPPPFFQNGYMNQISIDLTGVADTGDSYFLMWLPDSGNIGDRYGLVDPSATLPSAGSSENISSSITAGSADCRLHHYSGAGALYCIISVVGNNGDILL